MSKTVREIVSELASDIRAHNLDDRVSFRYLYSKFKGKVEYFLRLESKSREILKDPSVWKTISCVELEDTSNTTCGYIDGCSTLKKSKTKLPKAMNTSYGPIIKVFTVDGRTEIGITKPHEYSDYTNREYKTKKLAFWIENDYLYLPDTAIEAVKVMLIAEDESAVDAANGTSTGCSSALDATVSYPDYIIALAKQEVLKEISSVYKQVTEDEKGDDNTNNKK